MLLKYVEKKILQNKSLSKSKTDQINMIKIAILLLEKMNYFK